MKKLFLGSMAFAAVIAGPAVAADMPVRVRAAPVVYYDWSGAYGGFSAGGIWTRTDRNYPYFGPVIGIPGVGPGGGAIPFPTTSGGLGNHRLNSDDGVWDAHIGFQGQWGSWVLGVEATITSCFNECVANVALGPPAFAPNVTSQTKLTNLYTLGPRLGYAWDRWMLYATGGAAAATLKDTYCVTSTGLCNPTLILPAGAGVFTSQPFNGQTTNWGYFIGGGLEAMIHKGSLVDVILGVEYVHFQTRSRDAVCANAACAVKSGLDDTLEARGDKVTARITIKTQGYGFLN